MEVRKEGQCVTMSDEQRAEYIKTLRRIADKLERGEDSTVAFVLGAAHEEDQDEKGVGQAVTAIWGRNDHARALSHGIVRELMPPELRELLDKAQVRVERLNVASEAANKGDGVAFPRGLNPADADAAKLVN